MTTAERADAFLAVLAAHGAEKRAEWLAYFLEVLEEDCGQDALLMVRRIMAARDARGSW